LKDACGIRTGTLVDEELANGPIAEGYPQAKTPPSLERASECLVPRLKD